MLLTNASLPFPPSWLLSLACFNERRSIVSVSAHLTKQNVPFVSSNRHSVFNVAISDLTDQSEAITKGIVAWDKFVP